MILRDRIITLRKALHKTQEQVADELYISLSAYSSYERGLRNPSFETLSLIADYYGVSVDYLTGRTDVPSSAAVLSDKALSILRELPEMNEQTADLVMMALLVGRE